MPALQLLPPIHQQTYKSITHLDITQETQINWRKQLGIGDLIME